MSDESNPFLICLSKFFSNAIKVEFSPDEYGVPYNGLDFTESYNS